MPLFYSTSFYTTTPLQYTYIALCTTIQLQSFGLSITNTLLVRVLLVDYTGVVQRPHCVRVYVYVKGKDEEADAKSLQKAEENSSVIATICSGTHHNTTFPVYQYITSSTRIQSADTAPYYVFYHTYTHGLPPSIIVNREYNNTRHLYF